MKRMNKTKSILALVLVALLLTCAVGGTVAYLVTKTDAVTNTFTPAKVTCKVDEKFSQGDVQKEEVRIQNTGNTEAWIRATVVANWCDVDGNIVAPWTGPAIDYKKDNWTQVDDYWYYDKKVAAQEYTDYLFDSYTATGGPEGTHLVMTIVCQAVQSNLGESAHEAFTNAQKQPTTAGN
ncbi:MAG: hypothetical protein ACI4MK_04140 [Aristaeellaceae bacterium]